MVKKSMLLMMVLLASALPASAQVNMFIDSAPTWGGSATWQAWWDSTKASVVNGPFENMQSGTFPGTTSVDPVDFILMTSGPTEGHQLRFIYWIPGATVSSLTGNIEVKRVIDWGGDAYSLSANSQNWNLYSPDTDWYAPVTWEDYAGGVIGTMGFSFSSSPAGLAAFRDDVLAAQTFARGEVRVRTDSLSLWTSYSITATVVPEPCTAVLGLAAMALLGRARRRFN